MSETRELRARLSALDRAVAGVLVAILLGLSAWNLKATVEHGQRLAALEAQLPWLARGR